MAALEQAIGNRPKIAFVAESMGGLLMLRYAERHPERVVCMAGIYPVCSTTAILNSKSHRGDIITAYLPSPDSQ